MTQPAPARPGGLRLGLRANLAQFSLLVGVNALVGGMVGQERSLLSLLATQVFGLAAVSAALIYIVAFGLTKAATNFLAGTLADRYGRKPVLVIGWLVGHGGLARGLIGVGQLGLEVGVVAGLADQQHRQPKAEAGVGQAEEERLGPQPGPGRDQAGEVGGDGDGQVAGGLVQAHGQPAATRAG